MRHDNETEEEYFARLDREYEERRIARMANRRYVAVRPEDYGARMRKRMGIAQLPEAYVRQNCADQPDVICEPRQAPKKRVVPPPPRQLPARRIHGIKGKGYRNER